MTILPAIRALPGQGNASLPVTGFLAFADAQFEGLSAAAPAAFRGTLGPLPETADEVRTVAALLGQGEETLQPGADATDAAVKSARLDLNGTLYFATHGLIGDDVAGDGALSEAALALAPGGSEDGFLTMSETIELRLNARIVVLSACNTASGG